MSTLPRLFLNNLLPILLIAGIGYLLGKWLHVDPRSVSRIVLYALSPFLIFDLLARSELSNGDMFRIIAFALANTVVIGLSTWLLARFLKLERKLFAAVLLTTILINAGNYGLSLNLFAFGETALAHASLYYVTLGVLTYTVGVAIASMGSFTVKQSLLKLAAIPTLYTAILGALFNLYNWALPVPLERTISLLSDATIPTMLLVLGLQLQRHQRFENPKALILASSMRLLGGPLAAIALAGYFGLQGVARQAGITEAAMPAAVVTTILSTEFDVEPAFVTTVVFTTTLLSPLTLTPILAYLGA